MLERMEGQLGESHAGELRRESAEVRAERIITAELGRLGWSEAQLRERRKSDPAKLALAVRLRRETALTVGWIAHRLHLGTRKSAAGATYEEAFATRSWDIWIGQSAPVEVTLGTTEKTWATASAGGC
jgi:hypothetical protein